VIHAENRIELAGFLGADPQIRYLPSGTKVANASLAEGYRWTSNNEQKEHTNWHKLVFYGAIADVAGTSAKATISTSMALCKSGNSRPRTATSGWFMK